MHDEYGKDLLPVRSPCFILTQFFWGMHSWWTTLALGIRKDPQLMHMCGGKQERETRGK